MHHVGTVRDTPDSPRHILTPFYNDGHSTVSRIPVYFTQAFCKGDEALVHTALPFKASADLMWLAARWCSALARGPRLVAVTIVSAFIVTWHVPVPGHDTPVPLQPPKV